MLADALPVKRSQGPFHALTTPLLSMIKAGKVRELAKSSKLKGLLWKGFMECQLFADATAVDRIIQSGNRKRLMRAQGG